MTYTITAVVIDSNEIQSFERETMGEALLLLGVIVNGGEKLTLKDFGVTLHERDKLLFEYNYSRYLD